MVTLRKLALPLSISAGIYACAIRPRILHWDATDEEVQTWCPGDPEVIGFEGFVCRDPYGSFAAPYVEVVIAPAP